MGTYLRDGLPSALRIESGRLLMSDCDVAALADRFGTPLFVVSEDRLVENVRRFREAFESSWPDGPVRIMAAIKANPVTAIRRILSREGAGCDTFGGGELELAIRGGVDPADIAVNGSIKSAEIIRRAIEIGAHVVLDSPRELDLCEQESVKLGRPCQVLFRVKPWLEGLDKPSDFFPARTIREMTQTVKYGIPTSELIPMLRRVRDMKFVEPVGVHMHVGRHTKRTEAWGEISRSFVEMISTMRAEIGNDWSPRRVSLGGGMAAEADRESRVEVTDYPTPSIGEVAEEIATSFRDAMRRAGFSTEGVLLGVEPGRALHNDTGIHIARVHVVKHESENIDRRWIETDTSECFLSVGSLNVESPFDYVFANKAGASATDRADIVGVTCNYECLAEQAEVPDVEPGDVLAFLNTGSYIEPYTCNFNALPRPGMVLVHGRDAALIKRAETLEEVFARDVLPEHLA